MHFLKEIVSKANKNLNSEEAKRIRKKLLTIGIILVSIGAIGLIISFALFVSNMNSREFNVPILPFILFMPCAISLGIGTTLIHAALSIVIAGVGSKIVDTNKYCSKCGDIIEPNEQYCSHCGQPLFAKKICPKCQAQNDVDDNFCRSCGERLN